MFLRHDEELKRIIRKEIDDEFSYLDSNPSLHNVIMSKIEGERIVKRKVSMTLVFAIVMTIVIGSMAFAAGLGLFEHFSVIKSDQPAYSERLERLDQLAVTVGETIEIVTPEWTGETDTDYGKIAASQAGRKFTLTIDEAYCDGNKLFYTYTFSHDPNKSFSGEGKPTGFDAWDIEWPDVEWGTQPSWVNSQFNEKENTLQLSLGMELKYAKNVKDLLEVLAIYKALGTIFTKEGINNLGGPIAIVQQQMQISQLGFGYFLYFWGLISCNLAIFNLLPFPGLDGWPFLVLIIEGITKKEINPKVKSIMSTVGMVLLFGLMIIVAFSDIIRLFK